MPGEVQEFVSLTPWTMIFEVVNLLIVMLILKKFLFKPVNAVLEQRQAEIGGMYQKAEDAQKEAQALKQAYDERMSGARKEADELIVAAQDSAAAGAMRSWRTRAMKPCSCVAAPRRTSSFRSARRYGKPGTSWPTWPWTLPVRWWSARLRARITTGWSKNL